jgi:hypothetical protein
MRTERTKERKTEVKKEKEENKGCHLLLKERKK